MRLICPNCGAQYDVEDAVIPESGRNVQCSNCLHTWFKSGAGGSAASARQPSAASSGSAAAEPAPGQAPEPISDPQAADASGLESLDAGTMAPEPPAQEPENRSSASRAAPRVPRRLPEPDEYDDDGDNAPGGPPLAPARLAVARARALDPAVAEVLREEAARESRRRAQESSSLESQPDLGPAEPPHRDSRREARKSPPHTATPRARRPRQGNRRMTATRRPSRCVPERRWCRRHARAPRPPRAAARPAKERQDLLPDVEEINRTLRSARERRRTTPPRGPVLVPRQHSRFWRGFTLAFLVVVALVLPYIYAPQIAEAIPAAGPALENYRGADRGGAPLARCAGGCAAPGAAGIREHERLTARPSCRPCGGFL